MLFLKPTLPLAFEHGYNMPLSHQSLIPKERTNIRQHEKIGWQCFLSSISKFMNLPFRNSLATNLKFLLIKIQEAINFFEYNLL